MDKHSRRAKAHYRLVTAQEKAARRVESNTLRAQSMLYYIQGKRNSSGDSNIQYFVKKFAGFISSIKEESASLLLLL